MKSDSPSSLRSPNHPISQKTTKNGENEARFSFPAELSLTHPKNTPGFITSASDKPILGRFKPF
jgi:hypothetical protein